MANKIVQHMSEHIPGVKVTHFTSEYEGRIYSIDFITERNFSELIEEVKIIGDVECIILEDDYMSIELKIGFYTIQISFWRNIKKVSNF